MRAPRAAAPVLVVLAAALFGAPSAHAVDAGEEVGLSRDGVTWSPDLTTELFDPAMVWVPGDDEVTTLYVRNQTPDPARGFVEVSVGPDDAEFAADLSVRTRYDSGEWTVGATSPIAGLAGGAVLRIDLGVRFDPASGNESVNRVVPLSVRVVLVNTTRDTDPTPTGPPSPGGAPGDGAPGGGGPGALPAGAPVVAAPVADSTDPGPGTAGRRDGILGATGVDAVRGLLATGALVLAGAWFTVAGRRRETP